MKLSGKHKFVYYLLILIASILLVPLLILYRFHLNPEIALPRQVKESSLQFTHLWTRSRTKISNFPAEPFALVRNGSLIFFENSSLKSLDLLTGEIEWQKGPFKLKADAIGHNSQYIFIAYRIRGPRSYNEANPILGVIRVTAFDIESGEIVWFDDFEGITFVAPIVANEDVVVVNGSNGHGAFPRTIYIDPLTGTRIDYEGKSISVSEEATYYSLVYQGEERASNFYVYDELELVLTEDGTLWAKNDVTDVASSAVTFTRPSLLTDRPYRNIIVADKNVIGVYLGDSNQLFAFYLSQSR